MKRRPDGTASNDLDALDRVNTAEPRKSAVALAGAWICAALVVLLTFARFIPIGFTDHDSMDIAIHFWHDDYLLWLKSIAENTGRLFVFTNYFIAPYPYLFTSEVWLKSCALASLLGTVVLFFVALRRITGSVYFAMLCTMLFLAVASHSVNHSLFTGYYFFQLWAMAVLGTLILFHRGVTSGNRSAYAGALILWVLSLLLAGEEDRFLYGGFLVLIALHEFGKTGAGAARKTLRALVPFGVAVLVVGIAAVVYRYQNPSKYVGNQFDPASFSLRDYAKTLWIYTISSFPGYVFFDPVYQRLFEHLGGQPAGWFGLVRSMHATWVVRAGAVVILTAGCLWRVRPVGRRAQALLLAAAILALILPQAGLSLSEHYQAKALSGERVMTHFTFFTGSGLAIVLACVCCAIMVLTRRAAGPAAVKGVVGALSIAAGLASLTVDYGNHYVARFHQISGLKWEMVQRLCESGEFQALPEDTIVVAPELWRAPYSPGYYSITDFSGSHLVPAAAGEQNYWEKYIEVFANKRLRILNSLEDRELTETGFYYLNYMQASNESKSFASFGRITSRDGDILYTDSLAAFSRTADRSFQIHFGMKTPAPFVVDGDSHQAPDGEASISITSKATSGIIPTRIEGSGINLNSVYPSYLMRPEADIPVEVLTNPSFETWASQEEPEGWNVSGKVAMSAEARDGASVLALDPAGDGPNVVVQQKFRDGAALLGRQFRISIEAKSNETEKLGFNFYYTVGGVQKSFSKSHSGSGQWETITHEIHLPESADAASLRCLVTHRTGSREIAFVDYVRTSVRR